MKRIIMMITAMVLLTACSSGKETVAEPQKAQPVFSQTEKKEKTKDEIIEECLEKMTLDEKLGQMIMKEFRNDSAGEPITEINEEIKTVIQQEKIGGVVLFGENIVSAEQTKALLDALQEESEVPLFLAIDEEGGRVSRLKGSIDGYETLSAETLAEAGEEAVWEQYHKIGSTLSQLGFNLDFAPVADINTNPQNTVIGDRAFGSDPQKAGQYVTAAVKALQDENICSTLKHFPGHGDTYTDTHQEETFVNHTLDRLEEVEFVPFQMGIDAGAQIVMTAHIKTPKATEEDLPASLSEEIITGQLREKLGFEGIVITDALNMGAISQYYEPEFVAKQAVLAGVDILLMPQDVGITKLALKKAIENGEITEDRIDDSVRRILSVKYDISQKKESPDEYFLDLE